MAASPAMIAARANSMRIKRWRAGAPDTSAASFSSGSIVASSGRRYQPNTTLYGTHLHRCRHSHPYRTCKARRICWFSGAGLWRIRCASAAGLGTHDRRASGPARPLDTRRRTTPRLPQIGFREHPSHQRPLSPGPCCVMKPCTCR
jgi:hypothetical protein